MAARRTVFVITGARPSRDEEIGSRQRRYLITMAVRLACLLLATFLPVGGVVRLLLVAGAVALPWIAVIVANGGPSKPTANPSLLDPPAYRALESGRDARHHDLTRRGD